MMEKIILWQEIFGIMKLVKIGRHYYFLAEDDDGNDLEPLILFGVEVQALYKALKKELDK